MQKKQTSILKNDSDLNSKNWKPLEISDNKLSVDYDDTDTNNFDLKEVFRIGKITGSWVEPSEVNSENF